MSGLRCKGYPHGLKGEQIHLGARILIVADVFDAMLANRPYRNGLALEEVITHIRQGAGSHFDPHVVEAFVGKVVSQKELEKIFGLHD